VTKERDMPSLNKAVRAARQQQRDAEQKAREEAQKAHVDPHCAILRKRYGFEITQTEY
jgi:hypothetical protein